STETPPEPDSPPSSPVDLSTESLALFATRVQPILMNACANCHATGRGGSFKLTRTYQDLGPNRRATQQNLTAVLAQVNLNQPQMSPLLSKAVSQHGDMTQPPLKGRQAVAYHSLEEWVEKTLADNPHLRQQTAAVSGPEVKNEQHPEPPTPRTVPAERGNLAPPPAVAAPAPPTPTPAASPP